MFLQGFRAPACADGLFCGPLRASVRTSRLPAGCQRMARSEMADGLRWAGGYRAVNWRADGMQRADGCGAGARGWHAARWRMLCRGSPGAAQNDGRWLAGGRQMLCRVLQMVCGELAGGAQRVEGCCAGSKRMVRGGLASCQQKALRDYIWHARVITHFGKRAIHQVKRVCFP